MAETMIKILVLAANPLSTDRLQLDEEIREIQTRVRASAHRDLLQIETRLAVRPNDVIQAVLEFEPDVIHFIGHGSDTGELIFLDDSGNAVPVSLTGLAALMRAIRSSVRLVFLNACYSAQQADIIGQEIDFVVGMSDSVFDEAAIEFAATFYGALGFGRSITECFEIARSSLLLNNIPGEDTPKLMARTGASPGFVVLDEHSTSPLSAAADVPTVIVDKAESLPEALQYRAVRDGARLRIEPIDQYLDTVRCGSELTELSFWYSPWRLKFALPTLDVKMVNNTNQTVFFHRVVFEVKESKSDPRPIPVFWAQTYDGKLAFSNMGWGEMLSPKLTFGLAESRDREVDKRFEMPFDGEASPGYLPYDLEDFVDGPELEYEYPEGVAFVVGDLDYDYRDNDGAIVHVSHPVRVAVRLGARRMGLPRPPSYYYTVKLRASGSDYSVELPISHSLTAGEADRFQISIGCESATKHEFKLKLYYDNDRFVETGWVSVEVFVSQSEARQLKPVQTSVGDTK
jgi:hypothetical protein